MNILDVTHILTVLSAEELDQYGPEETAGVELRYLCLKDDPSENILQRLSQECDWLDRVLRGGTVIVHCQQGISRSSAIVVAYRECFGRFKKGRPCSDEATVMRRLRTNFSEAFAMMKKSRSIVNLNDGFREQLKVWEQCQYDIFIEDPQAGGGRRRTKKPAYLAWERGHLQKVDSSVGGTDHSTLSPKTPVREIGVGEVIDFLEAETD